MKYQFDLLPDEYKSFPRDNIAIALAVFIVVLTASAISTMNYKARTEIRKTDAQISECETQLRAQIEEANSLQLPLGKINALKRNIEFFNHNLDRPATSLVSFLAAFEATVPDQIVITNFSPTTFSKLETKFVITGEGPSVFDIISFVRRMSDTGKFKVDLRKTEDVVVDTKAQTRFELEFEYIP